VLSGDRIRKPTAPAPAHVWHSGCSVWLANKALHWKGIDRTILDINAAVPVHFVIADGIIGMEGNGLYVKLGEISDASFCLLIRSNFTVHGKDTT
jgi:hypothetical protein